jgi:cytoskeletal protein CcmA (bactofilin family)
MQTPSDRYRRRVPELLVLALALALVLPARGVSQPATRPSPAPAGAALSSAERRELRQSIERSYQVSGVHNGVLLKPRLEKLGVREVEVSGDAIAVNGARVSPQVLQSWIGDGEAAPLLRLLDLAPGERQALFGLRRDVAAASSATAANRLPLPSPSPPSPPTAPVTSEEPTAPAAPTPPTAPTPPAPPEPAEPQALPPPPPPKMSSGDRVRVGGPVNVEKGEMAEDVMTVGGSVHIDGEVNRDVSAVGGSVRVNGRVGGDVTAVGGSVHLGPHAEVMGDVAAIGGTVVREPGAIVHGSLSDVGSVLPALWRGRDDNLDDGWLLLAPVGHSLHMFWSLAVLLLLLLAVTLVVLLAPRALEQVRARAAGEPWTAAAAGVLSQILAAPALGALTVLLIISIVGCLLLVLIPFLILALMVMALVGFAGVAYQVGRVLEGRFGSRPGGAFLTTIVGVLAIEAPSLIGHLLAVGGGFLHVFAMMFLLFGLIVRYAAWTVGFGAALLTAFANRPQRFRRQPPPAPAATTTAPPAPHAIDAAPPAAAPGGGLA